jgi:hypothetical protein
VCRADELVGKWNLIEVPQPILGSSLEEQLAALSDPMRSYLERYNGFCPFFGRVTGFRFVRSQDYLQFDKSGTFIERVDKAFRRGPGVSSDPLTVGRSEPYAQVAAFPGARLSTGRSKRPAIPPPTEAWEAPSVPPGP